MAMGPGTSESWAPHTVPESVPYTIVLEYCNLEPMRGDMSRKPENRTGKLEALVDVFGGSGDVEFLGWREFRTMERLYRKKGDTPDFTVGF